MVDWSWSEVRSEIPQIEVITAIIDSDTEENLARLLFGQGWSIIYRALEPTLLLQTLRHRIAGKLRTIVVYSSEFDDCIYQVREESEHVIVIKVDQLTMGDHELVELVRSRIRAPLIHSQIKQVSEEPPRRRMVAITGTSGSPGRTFLALNLSRHLAMTRRISLIDGDFKSPTLQLLNKSFKSSFGSLEIVSFSPEERPIEVRDTESELTVVDFGVVPPVSEMVTDRRWQAQFHNSVLSQSSHLIFVCKPHALALIRLRDFLAERAMLLHTLKMAFVLNQVGTLRSDRAIEEQFLALTQGSPQIILPSEPRTVTTSELSGYSPLPSRSRLSRAIADLAVELAL